MGRFGGMWRGAFGARKPDGSAVDRVRTEVRTLLGLSDDTTIVVN